MSRLIAPVRPGAALAASGQDDDYVSRVAKYIPGEVVAAYTALLGILANMDVSVRDGFSIAAFAICVVANVVYLRVLAKQSHPFGRQAVVSTIAFGVWSYAVGRDVGLFGDDMLGWYEASIASFLLVSFTLVSGAVPAPKGRT